MEGIGPGDLAQPGVSHGDIEPVVSARVGNLRAWLDNLSRGERGGDKMSFQETNSDKIR